MKEGNGFSLSEVIIAMGIIMMLVAVVLPIHHMVETERHRIKQHQLVKLALHDELLDVIWGINTTMAQIDMTIAKRKIHMVFSMEAGYVKGCAEWENVRRTEEKICLYGIKEV